MKIVKCSKCGNYIHKADKCFHCGNTSGFEETEAAAVHENVSQDYARMEVLVEDKKFDEAISLSYTILEWMPNLAGVFWLRLLARNKCTAAVELICKGFPCEEDPDFCNALRFSTGEEHRAYEDIQKAVSEINHLLKSEINENEYRCKSDTNIMRIKRTMQDEIDDRQQKLFALWSDLEDIEHSLYAIEMDCRLLTEEHQTGLEKAVQAASAIKVETYRREECSEDKLHSFQVKLGNVLEQSESSKDSLERMKKQHPWVKTFSDLVSQRNQKVNLINSEIASLANYEQAVQRTITEIESIESRHKAALAAVDEYHFQAAADILGAAAFNQILRSAGVSAGSSIITSSTFSVDAQPAGSDDEMNSGDDFASWGLSED